MAENTQTFILVGDFKDNITPQLRKLDDQIARLTKTFTQFSKTLRPISKELGVMAMAAERMAAAQRGNRSVVEGNIKVLREYKKVLGQTASAQQSFSRSQLRGMRPPRGGGGGTIPGSTVRGGGPGLGAIAVAGAAAGLGFTAAAAALNGIKNAAVGFVQSGQQAEQAIIGMAGTLQTLGKVGDFQKSTKIAEQMMGDLSKVAAALPGSTQDYLTIMQQTLDDQIQAFGSVEAVQKNLKGFDVQTGKKLAGGMEQSFTALFGMASQIAGLRPQLAAMDLNQLRQSPTNLRQIQVLNRNPTLAKFYLEELKKTGGDFILALNNAMKKAITPEQIEALKNTYDSAAQTFITTFTDPYTGIFSPMKKVKISVDKIVNGMVVSAEEEYNTMQLLGAALRNINGIIELILATGMEPMKMINQFLFEVAYFFYDLRMDLEDLGKELNLNNFAEVVGNAIGEALGRFGTWLANLDYEQFFRQVDQLIYNFFKGLFQGFLRQFKGIRGGNKGIFGALGTSVTGTIISLIALTNVVKTLTAVMSAVSGMGMLGAGGGAGGLFATIAGWLGAVGPALSLMARVLPGAAAALATIALLGGGLENGMRQIGQVFGEVGNSVFGSLSAFGDVISTVMAYIADLGNGIGKLVTSFTGIKTQFDLLKIILTPITAAFQALELGLRGLNTLLAHVRSWITNMFGSEEEKKAAREAAVKSDVSMRQAQGRQNAYNLSMQGPEVLKKSMNDALYELSHSTTLKASRSAELKAFVAEAKAQLGGAKATAAPRAYAGPTGAAPAAAPAAPAITPQEVKAQTTAMQNVKASTDGVKAAVTAASNTAKTTAAAQGKKTDLMVQGLNAVKSALMAISSKVSTQGTLLQVAANTAKTNTLLESGKLKVSFSLSGIGGKGGPGAVDAFNPIASNFGLQITSGYRPGDPGYHGSNRARDYSNGTSPTPQMMAFAKFMAANYGAGLSELIYTPLGFSIKNGQMVPPYAQAGHYNHVHVAFGRGLGQPTLFSSANAAMAYERMMAPSGSRIATVTSNSSELGGSPVNLTQNITVDGSMDPKATAEAVWAYTTQAVEKLRYNNFG